MGAVRRPAYLAYGVLAYLAFGLALGWAAIFIGAFGPLPTVDRGSTAPVPLAVAVDLALLGLFAVQHTVMARPAFKRLEARLLPAGAERSTFVLAASLCLLLLFWQWRSLPGVVWQVTGPAATVLGAVYGLGWLTLVSSTFMIDHLDLFGLRQSWAAARQAVIEPPPFQTRWLYAWIRHPIMTGFLLLFWAAPVMTLSHLLFAAAASGYILVGIWFEERDLLRGVPEYAAYRRRVGGLLPKPKPAAAGAGVREAIRTR